MKRCIQIAWRQVDKFVWRQRGILEYKKNFGGGMSRVQQAIRKKKEAFKKWHQNGSEIDREDYKQKRKETKVVMASIKAEEYEN